MRFVVVWILWLTSCAIPDVGEIDLKACLEGCNEDLSACLDHAIEHVALCTPEDASCFADVIVEVIDCNESFGTCAGDCAGDVEDALKP